MHAWDLRLRRVTARSRLRAPPCCFPTRLTPSAHLILAISELIYFRDTQPTCAPIPNASSASFASRLHSHGSGSGWFAIPFPYDSFIHYFTPVYPDAIQAKPPAPHREVLRLQ